MDQLRYIRNGDKHLLLSVTVEIQNVDVTLMGRDEERGRRSKENQSKLTLLLIMALTCIGSNWLFSINWTDIWFLRYSYHDLKLFGM